MDKTAKRIVRGLVISVVSALFYIPIWFLVSILLAILGFAAIAIIIPLAIGVFVLQMYIIGWVAEQVIQKWVR